MAQEDQAQADLQTETTVVDPLDATNLPNNGTAHPFDSFQDEVQAALNGTPDEPQRPEQSADEFEELDPQAADEPDVDPFEEEEVDEDEPSAKSQERFRFKSDDDKAVAAIAKAKGVSLVEAARIYSGEQPPARAAESTQEQQSAPSENLAGIESEIEELYEQKDAAIRAIDVDQQAELEKQIRQLEKKARLLAVTEAEQSARAAQTQLQQAQQDFDTTWDFSRNRYPELNDPNSAMYKEVARLDAEMQELGDPLASDPKRLWDLAKRAGLNTRTPMTKPGDKSSAPQKGKQSSPVQPASGNARAATTDPAKRTTDVIEGLKTADDFEELVASLGR